MGSEFRHIIRTPKLIVQIIFGNLLSNCSHFLSNSTLMSQWMILLYLNSSSVKSHSCLLKTYCIGSDFWTFDFWIVFEFDFGIRIFIGADFSPFSNLFRIDFRRKYLEIPFFILLIMTVDKNHVLSIQYWLISKILLKLIKITI